MIAKYLHERGEDPRGVADGVDSSCMEKKGRCSQPLKILRHHIAGSCPKGFWTEEYRVNISLRQRSVLSPLLFIT